MRSFKHKKVQEEKSQSQELTIANTKDRNFKPSNRCITNTKSSRRDISSSE